MPNGPNGFLEIAIASVHPAWSLTWAVLWGMVAYNYGSAALATWKSNKTPWSARAADITEPLMYAVRHFFCRSKTLCRLFRLDGNKANVNIIPTNSPGNILRISIFIASMTPISFGLAFAFVEIWDYSNWRLFTAMFFMMTSIVGALGHLFLANRENPSGWGNIVAGTIIWLLVGPIFGYLSRVMMGQIHFGQL